MAADAIRQLLERYAAAWADHDREAWLDTFAPDAIQEDPVGDGVRRGRDEIGGFWDQAMESRDGITIRPRSIHVSGSEAAMEWTIVARNGDRHTTFDGVDVFTFTEGPLISSVRAYWDRSTFRAVDAAPRGPLVALTRGPFGGPEAAFYELLAAPAVRRIVAPVLADELSAAPAGLVLDVGCGGGAMTAELASVAAGTRRGVVGVDASAPQVRRARRRGLPVAAASAGRLPFRAGSLAAVVSSCALKHWPDRGAGVAECARILAPGGRIVLVEIDGGEAGDLARFATLTRIPPGVRRLYPWFARHSFVPLSPSAEEIAADLVAAGVTQIRHRRLHGLPFVVVTGTA